DEKKKVPVKRKTKRGNIEPEIQPTKKGSMQGASNYPEKHLEILDLRLHLQKK
ncbi:hypothetical protein CDAR_118071, partial [Caerostris darwini]